MFKKIGAMSAAMVLFALISFPLSQGLGSHDLSALKKANAFTGGINPVGSNIVVEIAKEQNPAVVYVSTKTKHNEMSRNFGFPRGPDPFRRLPTRAPRPTRAPKASAARRYRVWVYH